jgi:hypothetical protein
VGIETTATPAAKNVKLFGKLTIFALATETAQGKTIAELVIKTTDTSRGDDEKLLRQQLAFSLHQS